LKQAQDFHLSGFHNGE